jgi:RNA polymerase sigma-70 factor (TIGR02960 family)
MSGTEVSDDFATEAEQYRRELHVHCYRMLASYDEAEDAIGETYLKAWRSRDGFDGENLRAWLYRIATNVCIDRQRAQSRRLSALRSFAEVSWMTPYPDTLLDEVPATDDEPDAVAVARETIELAFLAALQALPARQRAVLVAREVLGMSAAETADLLGTSVAAANSAVQRARDTMRRHLPSHRSEWSARPASPEEGALLAAFIDAHERCDASTALSIAATDLRVTMPPLPVCFDGRDAVAPLLDRAFGADRDGDWRLLPTAVNRMPAAASYLRRTGDSVFRAFKLDVLRVEDDHIAEITTFGPALFALLGLPDTCEP